MLSGLLMELEDHNCWTIAEAAGHCGPHRLQHLLSRAVWDDQQVLDIASAWAVSHLDDGDAVLIVDETADEKSSTDAIGAARQYSGTVGGIALCQVAVTLTYATGRGHALIGRALYLPQGCAADEEHRELAGVPEQVMFATKPQLAGSLLDRAHRLGIRAAFVAGDEVYGGRELRRGIRQRGTGYVMAVRANHTLTTGSGRTVTAAAAAGMIPAHAWHRMRTGSGTKGTRHYDWAMFEVTSDDTPDRHGDGHSVLLARRHRYTGTLSYYRCWTPEPVPLSRLIAIAVTRWRIGRRSPTCQAEHWPGRRTGHPLEVLAPLDRGLPARLYLSRCRRSSATPARGRLRPGCRTDPDHIAGAAAAPARHRHPATPARPGPIGCTGQPGDAATSTAPAKPTNAGTPTPRQHHDHNELQLPYQFCGANKWQPCLAEVDSEFNEKILARWCSGDVARPLAEPSASCSGQYASFRHTRRDLSRSQRRSETWSTDATDICSRHPLH
jgi:SRSO17 transposase